MGFEITHNHFKWRSIIWLSLAFQSFNQRIKLLFRTAFKRQAKLEEHLPRFFILIDDCRNPKIAFE